MATEWAVSGFLSGEWRVMSGDGRYAAWDGKRDCGGNESKNEENDEFGHWKQKQVIEGDSL